MTEWIGGFFCAVAIFVVPLMWLSMWSIVQ